jgi:hypothetical protein
MAFNLGDLRVLFEYFNSLGLSDDTPIVESSQYSHKEFVPIAGIKVVQMHDCGKVFYYPSKEKPQTYVIYID